MYLLYIDDSGDDGRSPASSSHFLLGGLAIRVSAWRGLVQRIDKLVVKHLGDQAVKVELHGSDMLSGRNFYRSVPSATREALFHEVLEEIGKPTSPASLFFVVVHKGSLPVTRGVRIVATLQLCQRFNAFLTRESEGKEEHGLLICDEHTQQSQVKSLLAVIHSGGLPRQLRDNLIETAFFVESHESRVLQAADLACHAVYRFITQGDDRFTHLIERRIVRDTERRRDKRTGKASQITLHYGLRYIAADPASGLSRVLPFKHLRVTKTTNLPRGSFLPVGELEKELTQHGM
jgi:Fe-S cluster assembly scaffold protein SufB